ncbi:MAG: pyridoxal kinase [Pseudomonadota bacterium]
MTDPASSTRRPRILSLQSQVAYGHVGNSAAVFALQRRSIDVISLPTALLSHHPGHGAPAGVATDAGLLGQMTASLQKLPVFREIDGVLTGYIGAADQAPVLAEIVDAVRAANPKAIYICDPVLGDEPKGIYVDEARAAAIADTLVPKADIITPNLFELQRLAGGAPKTLTEIAEAAKGLAPETVVTSTAPGTASAIAVAGGRAWRAEGPFTAGAPPSGLGDLFTAVYAGARLWGQEAPSALAEAVGAVAAIAEESADADEMRLVAGQHRLHRPHPAVTVAEAGQDRRDDTSGAPKEHS